MYIKLKSIVRTVILFFLLTILCSADKDEYTLIKSLPFPEATFLTTDNLGYSYVVVGNQLFKFDSQGKPVSNYSENNLGSLIYVDAVNPMKLLLFYRDFAQLIFLDMKLSSQSKIDLRSININQPLAACNSKEEGCWVYDREDDQLKKIDNNLQVVHQSGNLTQLLGYQINPGMMKESNGLVYINNPETGILVFDRFAGYFKTLPFTNLSAFQVVDKDLLFITNNKLFRYENKTLSEKEVLLPQHDSIRACRIEQNELYLLTSDSLKFYSF
jgi:hypothetical protein